MIGQNNETTEPIILHVHPENDEREHVIDRSMECWCDPKILDLRDMGKRVSHNSLDEREFVEKELGELLGKNKTWRITET